MKLLRVGPAITVSWVRLLENFDAEKMEIKRKSFSYIYMGNLWLPVDQMPEIS